MTWSLSMALRFRAVPLTYSFLIPSIPVTPIENLNKLPPAQLPVFMSVLLFPNHTSSNARLYPLHPACALFLTSVWHCPFLRTVDPKYLNPFNFHYLWSLQLHLSTCLPLLPRAYLPLHQTLSHLVPTLTTDHNVVSEHYSPCLTSPVNLSNQFNRLSICSFFYFCF